MSLGRDTTLRAGRNASSVRRGGYGLKAFPRASNPIAHSPPSARSNPLARVGQGWRDPRRIGRSAPAWRVECLEDPSPARGHPAIGNRGRPTARTRDESTCRRRPQRTGAAQFPDSSTGWPGGPRAKNKILPPVAVNENDPVGPMPEATRWGASEGPVRAWTETVAPLGVAQ